MRLPAPVALSLSLSLLYITFVVADPCPIAPIQVRFPIDGRVVHHATAVPAAVPAAGLADMLPLSYTNIHATLQAEDLPSRRPLSPVVTAGGGDDPSLGARVLQRRLRRHGRVSPPACHQDVHRRPGSRWCVSHTGGWGNATLTRVFGCDCLKYTPDCLPCATNRHGFYVHCGGLCAVRLQRGAAERVCGCGGPGDLSPLPPGHCGLGLRLPRYRWCACVRVCMNACLYVCAL